MRPSDATPPTASRAPDWHVVRTKPPSRSEEPPFLDNEGGLTFLPVSLVNHRHGSRRWHGVEPPIPEISSPGLFPSHSF